MKIISHKTCNKCKVDKPISEFGELASSKDGYKYRCDSCVNEYISKCSARTKKSRDKNIERYKETKRRYVERTREQYLSASPEWREEYRKPRREALQKWYKNNPEKYAELKNRRRARKLQNGVFRVETKFLRRLYASPCVACGGLADISADHIIPIARGGTHSEGNLQPLCKSCNSSKGAKLMVEFRQSRPDLFGCRIEVT